MDVLLSGPKITMQSLQPVKALSVRPLQSLDPMRTLHSYQPATRPPNQPNTRSRRGNFMPPQASSKWSPEGEKGGPNLVGVASRKSVVAFAIPADLGNEIFDGKGLGRGGDAPDIVVDE